MNEWLPQPLSQRKSHGAHAKRPKARGKPSQIQSNNAPSALFDGIGLGAVGVALFFCGLRAASSPHCSAKEETSRNKPNHPYSFLFFFNQFSTFILSFLSSQSVCLSSLGWIGWIVFSFHSFHYWFWLQLTIHPFNQLNEKTRRVWLRRENEWLVCWKR